MPPRKKRGGASSSRNAPTEFDPEFYGFDFPDPEQHQRFKNLSRIAIRATRYPCETSLHAMGIYDDVWALFTRLGWSTFLGAKWLTYKELVLEFLSTVEVHKANKRPSHFTFRLGNQDREMSIAQLNAALSCPCDNGIITLSGFSTDMMWKKVALPEFDGEQEYKSGRAKATSIRNPIFRYIQKVLAYTIFARDNTGSVRGDELLAFHCLVSNIPMNVGAHIAAQFVTQGLLTTHVPSKLCIGGFITPIAMSLGIDLSRMKPVAQDKDIMVDLDFLHSQQIILGGRRRTLGMRMKPHYIFNLPNPTLTTLTVEANWHMNTPAHWKECVHDKKRLVDEYGEDEEESEEEEDAQEQEVGEGQQAAPNRHAMFRPVMYGDLHDMESRLLARIDANERASVARFKDLKDTITSWMGGARPPTPPQP